MLSVEFPLVSIAMLLPIWGLVFNMKTFKNVVYFRMTYKFLSKTCKYPGKPPDNIENHF
jgi:hypothetical protein